MTTEYTPGLNPEAAQKFKKVADDWIDSVTVRPDAGNADIQQKKK